MEYIIAFIDVFEEILVDFQKQKGTAQFFFLYRTRDVLASFSS